VTLDLSSQVPSDGKITQEHIDTVDVGWPGPEALRGVFRATRRQENERH
jgi:hypothetical protein